MTFPVISDRVKADALKTNYCQYVNLSDLTPKIIYRLWTPQSAAITDPPMPQPAALWPSPRNWTSVHHRLFFWWCRRISWQCVRSTALTVENVTLVKVARYHGPLPRTWLRNFSTIPCDFLDLDFFLPCLAVAVSETQRLASLTALRMIIWVSAEVDVASGRSSSSSRRT